MGSRELEVHAECHEALALTAPIQEIMAGSVKGEILMGLIREIVETLFFVKHLVAILD